MQLNELLYNVNYSLLCGNLNIKIDDISYDSRNIDEHMAFIALKGIDVDGHKFINDVINKGCKCVIVCEDIDVTSFSDVTVVKVDDTREKLVTISENLFKNPKDKLIKIGITGTKGKTSASYMLKSILESANEKVGLIGTVGTIIDGKLYEHKNTTPESYLIQKYMRMMVDTNTKYLIMEVSSQALKVGRVSNIVFDYAIFTNLSLDHVGEREHPTFEDYVECKSRLFKQTKVSILNKDDKYYDVMKENAKECYTFGKSDATLTIKDISYNEISDKVGIKLTTDGIIKDEFNINSLGLFSAYNALGVILLSNLLNIKIEDIKNGLESFKIPGRCELYHLKNNAIAIIDFAHNVLSMQSIIESVKDYKKGKIITVFGCGGGRSYDRRRELGELSGKLSDISIITTDNPRNDDVNEICNDIAAGVNASNGEYKIIIDREKAIKEAISISLENDIILLLGKGHEKFQEIGNEIIPFDEEKILREYM